jgi:hypothetical protein
MSKTDGIATEAQKQREIDREEEILRDDDEPRFLRPSLFLCASAPLWQIIFQ